MVLFKNPVDSQAVMLLARQMYPRRSEIFMNTFTKATKQPYNPMMVDLKAFTPENDRLKTRIIWRDETDQEITNQKPNAQDTVIKEDVPPDTDHYSVGLQTDNIASEETTMADKMNACDDCGLLFDTPHDVQRHVKRGWCAETQEPAQKKQKMEEESDTESLESIEDNEAYLHLWQLAKSEGKKRYEELYDNYIDQGENDNDASDLAEERVKPYEEKCFINRYSTLLETYWWPLKNNPFHVRVLKQIEALTDKGLPVTSSVKRVLRKMKPKFEDLFETDMSEDEQDSGEESDDTEQKEDI